MPGVESLDKISKASQNIESSQGTQSSFESMLTDAISQVEQMQEASDEADELLAAGGIDDLHTAMILAEQSKIAVEFTTQLTSRAVSAYNQIMNMQV